LSQEAESKLTNGLWYGGWIMLGIAAALTVVRAIGSSTT
jgi:hypothetical protein